MAKSKTKTAYVCDDCGAEHSKWQGQCGTCSAWNTLSRVNVTPVASAALGYAGVTAEVKKLGDIEAVEAQRIRSGFTELDRVLGGGFVPGSVVLIGGDPGAGKSTLLLQASTALAANQGVLYVTGEESLQQLALRAQRLQLPMDGLSVAAETRAEVIAKLVETQRPKIVILDSIQVMQMESVDSTPGSVTQVRETASFFTRLAKQQDIVIVLVGAYHQGRWHRRAQGAGAYDRLLHDAG
jgi:DNA repair protein RadA/Sms